MHFVLPFLEHRLCFRVMRCSLNYIPQTKDLLNKSRLPFGLLLHPFKDLDVCLFLVSQLLNGIFTFDRI